MGKFVQKKGKDKNLQIDMEQSLLDIPVTDIDGNEGILRDFIKDKKCIMIVNVASKCAFSNKTYKEMIRLHKEYRDRGFQILAFPCNQFLKQEPGNAEDIKSYAIGKHGAEFPIFEKTQVNGDNTCDVYKYLR